MDFCLVFPGGDGCLAAVARTSALTVSVLVISFGGETVSDFSFSSQVSYSLVVTIERKIFENLFEQITYGEHLPTKPSLSIKVLATNLRLRLRLLLGSTIVASSTSSSSSDIGVGAGLSGLERTMSSSSSSIINKNINKYYYYNLFLGHVDPF